MSSADGWTCSAEEVGHAPDDGLKDDVRVARRVDALRVAERGVQQASEIGFGAATLVADTTVDTRRR